MLSFLPRYSASDLSLDPHIPDLERLRAFFADWAQDLKNSPDESMGSES